MSGPGQSHGSWKLPRPLRWLAILTGALLLFLIVLAVGLGLATDRWIRPVVEEQASIAIPGEVSIGGLAVSLLGLSVTVDRLAIRPDEPDAEPVLELGRLYVSLARLPLFTGHVVVDDIQIDAPVLRVVREPSGEINLLKVLVPETPESPAPEPTPSEPLPVRVRSLLLGAGEVEFVDRASPRAQPLKIALPAARIQNVIVTGDPGEDPADLHLEITSDGASVAVDGSFQRTADRLSVDATVDAAKLPLSRAWVYLPDFGWSKLDGELDAKIHYVNITGKQQTAEGSVAVRGLQVVVPKLKDPVLSLESLSVKLDQLDLLGRRIALGQVTLEKPRLFFDPIDRANQPLLPNGIPAAGEPTPGGDTRPFAWSLAGLQIDGAQFVPIGEDLQPLGLDATVGAIASAPQGPTDVTLALAQGDGSVAVAGKVYAAPVGFNGKITLDALALAPLLRLFMAGPGPRVDDGVVKGELEVKLGSLAAGEAPAAGGDLHVGGTITLEKLDAKSDAEGTIGAKVQKIALALKPLELPGLLPSPSDGAASGAPDAAPNDATVPVDAPASASPDTGAPAPAPVSSAPAAPGPAPAAAPALRWDPPADAGTVRLVGSLEIDGVAVRAPKGEPFAFDLKSLDLALTQLELPGLLPPAGAPAAEGAGRLRLSGTLALAGIVTKSGKEGEFGFDLEKLDLGLKQIELPGLLAAAGAKPPADPVRIVLDRARITSPKLRLTRSENGIVLPAVPGAEARPADAKPVAKQADGAPSAEKKGAKRKATPTTLAKGAEAPRPEAGGPGVHLELGSLALEGGSLRFVDRTVKPFYQGEVTGLQVNARDLSFPPASVRDVSIKLDAPGPAPIWALGAYTPASSWFEFNLDKLPLAPLNPYVRNASGYVVNGGELSLYSKGSRTGDRIYAANWITLFDPNLSGGGPDAPLEKSVGVPVSLALALLKDPSGNIGLSVPIDYDKSGASVRLGSVIGSALTQVLIGALTSPLKLLGAVVEPGGKVKDATPEPIHFVPGRAELGADDDERVGALAKLAATRPGLVLRLSGQTSGADGQFLREAKLLEAIDSGEGLPEEARGLGKALVRRRLRGALEARLESKPTALDPEDAQTLETWLAAVAVGPESLAELARKRAARVQELLQKQFGLDAKQIQQAEPGPPGGSPDPSVDVAIGS
jgi:hypothetical protein